MWTGDDSNTRFSQAVQGNFESINDGVGEIARDGGNTGERNNTLSSDQLAEALKRPRRLRTHHD